MAALPRSKRLATFLVIVDLLPMATALDLENSLDGTQAEHLSRQGWNDFLTREIEATLHVYRTKPKLLLSQAREELQIAGDYAGRELLELVQNAADAAAELGGKGRVRIEINRQGLIVGNTGQPFRPGGVESLMTAHTSDKPNRKIKLIGAKGLGFRALLNWSHEPIVSSGELEIGFSEGHAAGFIRALAADVPKVAKICDEEENLPVPILAFPAFGNAMQTLEDEAQLGLLGRARTLRAEGFDTVIAAPFHSEDAFSVAMKQAAEFAPTFLLFVEALEEIELHFEGNPPKRWRRDETAPDTYALSVHHGEQSDEQEWVCLRKAGEFTVRGKTRPRFYELAIAFRRDEDSEASYLHSYFPTSIPVPFPALFHATLELDSSRKAIKQNSDVNQRVLAELAQFYAVSLEKLVRRRRIENVLDFLDRTSMFAEPLKEFELAVYRAIRLFKVISTMRGTRVRAEETSIGPAGYQNYLPTRLFGSLAKCRGSADRVVLDRLGIGTLSPPSILRILRKAELSLEERARAIAGIAASLNSQYHERGLFLDQHGQRMQGRNTLFPPPASSDRLPRLPDWAKARFIHPDLWKLVLRKTQGHNPREKLRRLSAFGISEYSNDSVISSLRRQAARAVLSGRRDPDAVQRELIGAVHAFYSREHRSPPGVFKVCCADGVWRDAREVHLSQGYGHSGGVNAALYQMSPEFLLGNPAANGIDPASNDVTAFFAWIGVNRWPRAEKIPLPSHLRGRVLGALPHELTVEDDVYHQTLAKQTILWGHNFEASCAMIVGLEGILSSAESDAILAWLGSDPRFDLASPDRFTTSARGRKDGKATYRPYAGELPDMVRDLIASTPWLACRDDSLQAPRDAMIEPGNLGELFHVPRAAAVESEQRFGLTQQLWRRGLEHAQVPRTMSDLPEASIFQLLGRLPDVEPSEAVVRALYNQILALDSFDADRAPSERTAFLDAGKVQVRRSRSREWVSPADALYADQTGLPAAVRDSLPVIDLPPRRNSGNVLQRFGVPALSQKEYRLEVTRLDEETGVLPAVLRSDFTATRPFIRALRLADANVTPRLRRFARMTLTVASTVEIAVTLDGQSIAGALEPWSHVLVGDALIVTIDSAQQALQIGPLAQEAIADGIAEVLDLQSGADFAKLLSAQDDGLRRILLRRMLTNLSDAEIDALLADIPAPVEAYVPVAIDREALARGPEPTSPDPGSGAPLPNQPATAAPGLASVSGAPCRPQNPNAVTARPLPPGPAEPTSHTRAPVRLRVTRSTGPVGISAHPDPYRAADAEEWTKLFEISEGRFPLAVLHLQGRDSFGCDWLSFASAEDREAFLEDPARIDLVVRFIETKSGVIELSDNQSRSAEQQKERFFIYRLNFYPGQRDRAELTIVRDPLSHRHALLARFEFRIDAVEGRERYQLQPDASASN